MTSQTANYLLGTFVGYMFKTIVVNIKGTNYGMRKAVMWKRYRENHK